MSRPRIRTVKPEFFQDEKVGHLSVHARLLFLGLITLADDEGRLRDHLNAIHGHVFPYDNLSSGRIKKAVAEVADAGLILRYKAGVGEYIVIRHWGRHQRINKPVDLSLPPPPDPVVVEENSFADSGDPRVPRGSIPEAVRRAVARREGATPGTTTDVACHYCDRPGTVVWPMIASGRASSWVTVSGLEFDHVVPLAAGGDHTLDNLVLACARCNRSKGAREGGTETRAGDVRKPVQAAVHPPSRVGARSVPFLEEQQGVKEPGPIDARAALDSLGAGLAAERLRETVAILSTSPRIQLDPELMGVANRLLANPDADHRRAAHIVVANLASPTYRTIDGGQALGYAFEELARSAARMPATSTDEKKATADRRRAAALSVYGEGTAA